MYRGGPTYNTYVAPPVYGGYGYGGYGGGGFSLFPTFVSPIFGLGGEPPGSGASLRSESCFMLVGPPWFYGPSSGCNGVGMS